MRFYHCFRELLHELYVFDKLILLSSTDYDRVCKATMRCAEDSILLDNDCLPKVARRMIRESILVS